jgi:hypothetical protein
MLYDFFHCVMHAISAVSTLYNFEKLLTVSVHSQVFFCYAASMLPLLERAGELFLEILHLERANKIFGSVLAQLLLPHNYMCVE